MAQDMDAARGDRLWHHVGGLTKGTLAVLAALGLSFAAFDVWVRSVRARNPTPFDDVAAVRARWPDREADTTALRLREAAAPLGFRFRAGATAGWTTDRQSLDATWSHLADETELTRLPRMYPLAPLIRHRLSRQQDVFREIRDILADHGPPVWPRRWSDARGRHETISFIEVRALARWLVSDALVAAEQGDTERGQRDLLAAWHLGLSLADEPSIEAIRMSIQSLSDTLTAWRVAGSPDGYGDLTLPDLRPSLLDAIRYASTRLSASPVRRQAARASWLGRLSRRAAEPFETRAGIELRRTYEAVLGSPLCDQDTRLPTANIVPVIPGQAVGEFWSYTVHRLARLSIEQELTRIVLDVAGDQAADFASRTCPGRRWIVETGPPRRVRLDRPVVLPHGSPFVDGPWIHDPRCTLAAAQATTAEINPPIPTP